MRNKIVLFTVVVVLVTSLLVEAERCSQVNDCDCDSVCVTKSGDKRCGQTDLRCTCKPGCTVFDVFIPAGTSGVQVYGNRCGCGMTGSAYCTRAGWRGEPDMSPYETNKNCDNKPK